MNSYKSTTHIEKMQKQKDLYEFKARLQFPSHPRLHCETLSLKKKNEDSK